MAKKVEKRKISPKIKRLFKDLHIKIGAAGLAILFGLAERSLKVMNDTFERKSLSRILTEEEELNNFYDYYDEFYNTLQGLKKTSYRSTLYRLKNKGLIFYSDEKGYKLTKNGDLYYKGLIDKLSNRKSNWDGKYRIIFFDIKEIFKRERNWLRRELVLLDFQPLQKSVYIGKWPLPEEILNVIHQKGLRNNVRIMTVGEVDDESIFNILENDE